MKKLYIKKIKRKAINVLEWMLTHISKRQISECYTLSRWRGTNFVNKVDHRIMAYSQQKTYVS